MSKRWTAKEEKFLTYWMKCREKEHKYQYDLLDWISQQLNKSKEECIQHWQKLSSTDQESQPSLLVGTNQESRLSDQIERLEQKLNRYQAQIEKIAQENQKLKKNMRFFEMMLIEEYHLLIRLLGKEKENLRIHQQL
ncbi:hypothetical protein [Thermoflavimicrobium daqui]|uniref:Uncharacterized protein n=1 Tax=Thermoflavimicrobium daqui TaxID=2137476 RepID=A0A364K5Z5_9BACL|nr:hypothetical protein [Thermoflavimicrobium daqui]RAL25632.1 hypothetical protein DL897_06015 [Thermoflavimicrobium daqui]